MYYFYSAILAQTVILSMDGGWNNIIYIMGSLLQAVSPVSASGSQWFQPEIMYFLKPRDKRKITWRNGYKNISTLKCACLFH